MPAKQKILIVDDDNNIVNFVPKKAFKYSEICHSYYIYSMYLFDN